MYQGSNKAFDSLQVLLQQNIYAPFLTSCFSANVF